MKNWIESLMLLCLIGLFLVSCSNPVNTDKKDNPYFLIPHQSWTCGLAGGIPIPESGVLLFEANLKLANVYNLGKTQYGQRKVYVVQSGTINSAKVSGTVLSGGIDFQLDLSNGAMEIEQLLVIRETQGSLIFLRSAGTAANQNDVRMVPDFEATGTYSWLNSGKYVGRRIIDLAAKTMKISVYDISTITVAPDSTNSIAVVEPTDVIDQSWDFNVPASGKKGNSVSAVNLSLGSSLSIGSSKRGTRNIIPITGGTGNGRITGGIIAAGADYQLTGASSTKLEQRFLYETNDGEIIICRNAGPLGALVPTFEAREASAYAYLNNGLFLSSDPGGFAGGISLTLYESTK